jgi:hypothetical protein
MIPVELLCISAGQIFDTFRHMMPGRSAMPDASPPIVKPRTYATVLRLNYGAGMNPAPCVEGVSYLISTQTPWRQ